MPGFDDKDDQSKSNEGGFDKQDQAADHNRVFLQVGDRVFTSAEDAAKHIAAAQSHIKKLEDEAKERDSNLDKVSAAAQDNVQMREVLEGLKQATHSQNTPATPAVSKDELVAEAVALATQQVDETLKTRAQSRMEDDNLASAMDLAREQYGEDFKDKVVKLGSEHGLTGKQINDLAKTQPMVFKTLFIPKTTDGKGPSSGDLNTSAFDAKPDDTTKKPFMKMTDSNQRAQAVAARIAAKRAQGQS